MKKLSFLALAIWQLSAIAVETQAIKPTNLFIPVGFDDNDEVTVVLDGYLPNSCYQLANIEIERDLDKRLITVEQMAYVMQGNCLNVAVPFTTPVSLGTLAEGEYTVSNKEGSVQQKLTVKKSDKTGPDDFVYAPIEAARVASLLPEPGALLVLEGRFTNTCLRISEVKLSVTGRTIQVQPITEMGEKDKFGLPCKKVEAAFTHTKRMPLLGGGRYLLHVRSMNGRAMNVAFTTDWNQGDPLR